MEVRVLSTAPTLSENFCARAGPRNGRVQKQRHSTAATRSARPIRRAAPGDAADGCSFSVTKPLPNAAGVAAILRPDQRALPTLSPASTGRLGFACVGSALPDSAGRFPRRTVGNRRVTRRDEPCASGFYACYAPTRTLFSEHRGGPMVPLSRSVHGSLGGRERRREASASKHGRSGGLRLGFRGERGGRRLGNGSVVAKNDVAKTPVRLRRNGQA